MHLYAQVRCVCVCVCVGPAGSVAGSEQSRTGDDPDKKNNSL